MGCLNTGFATREVLLLHLPHAHAPTPPTASAPYTCSQTLMSELFLLRSEV